MISCFAAPSRGAMFFDRPNWFSYFCRDVASDVGVNFKNVGVLSIESSLFHLFHYTFLQTKHQRKGYLLYFTLMKNERQIKIQRKRYR